MTENLWAVNIMWSQRVPITCKYVTDENGCGFKIDLSTYTVGCLMVMVRIMFISLHRFRGRKSIKFNCKHFGIRVCDSANERV